MGYYPEINLPLPLSLLFVWLFIAPACLVLWRRIEFEEEQEEEAIYPINPGSSERTACAARLLAPGVPRVFITSLSRARIAFRRSAPRNNSSAARAIFPGLAAGPIN